MRRNIKKFTSKRIRINAIAPGYTETPMPKAVANDPQYRERITVFLESIPTGRAGPPEEIADAATCLLSDTTGFICGTVLFVDGGHGAMLRPQ